MIKYVEKAELEFILRHRVPKEPTQPPLHRLRTIDVILKFSTFEMQKAALL